MATASDDWSVNANDATHISFVRPKAGSNDLDIAQEFHPQFTYPIVGTDETIFGYKDLKINIQFASHDCCPHLSASYSRKFPAVGSTKATDINEKFRDVLPTQAFHQGFDSRLTEDTSAKSWVPPGKLVHSYSREGRDFEVWAGSLLDARVRSLLDNIQVLILFFIEGGQTLPINEDPDWALERWKVYYLFEKVNVADQPNISPYVLSGYATTYRFYRFVAPKTKEVKILSSFPKIDHIHALQEPCRLRISQFLILPPHQSAGHGSELYQLIYREVISDSSIMELTVEDPSEEFDKLRDVNDFKTLEPEFRKNNISINTSAHAAQARFSKVPKRGLLAHETLRNIRLSRKIAPRQFNRQVELYLLAQIPESHRSTASLTKLLIQKHKTSNQHDRDYYWWRILVKSRIFLKNKELLMQISLDERRERLEDTCRGQQDEYVGLLLHMAVRKAIKDGALNGGGDDETSAVPRKRKVIEDDDEDEDDAASTASKRAKG